ncbi:MAG TPA: hypothetical protein VKA89_03240 [Solirubrobacterales bacterium]|nr:hypothetical protein [Solirubrobacterales bacterium]
MNRLPTIRRRATLVTLLAATALAALPAAAAASPAQFVGASTDGDRVFFTTLDKLVPGDTDNRVDIYERSAGTTRVLSTGPTGGNDAIAPTFGAASGDGSRVFFTTREALVSSDNDFSVDVYERSAGTTTRLSTGPAGGNGAFGAELVGITPDGLRAFVLTNEQLTSADTDNAFDIYMRSAGQTTLISGGSGNFNPFFNDAFVDSGGVLRVIFTTAERLLPSDVDSVQDVYMSTDGVLSHVSAGGNGAFSANYAGAAADGAVVFFDTSEQLGDGDADSSGDVYRRAGGVTTRVSQGATGGNGAFDATFEGASVSGDHVFVETQEPLEAGDSDGNSTDVYDRSGSTTTRVSAGAGPDAPGHPAVFETSSADGTTVVFSTTEQLDADDTDDLADVYARSGSTTTLVSGSASEGNGDFQAFFSDATPDTSEIYFGTAEPMAGDTDAHVDHFVNAGGAIELVTTGPQVGNPTAAASLTGVSDDGSHRFFVTDESVTSDDTDTNVQDVFDRSGSTTTLVSVGNSVAQGPPTPTLSATNPASPSSQDAPLVTGNATAGTQIKIYTTFDCSGIPAGTGTAAELGSTGIAATAAPNATTSFYATATDAEGDTSECSTPGLIYVEDSTAPAEPQPTSTNPASPSNVNDIRVLGGSDGGTTVRLYGNSSCSGPVLGSGTATEFGSPGIAVTVPDDSSTTFHATATDAAGNVSPCSTASVEYVELSTAPPAPVLSGTDPASPANENAPKLFGTAPGGSTVAVYTTAGCTGAPVATGTAAQLASGITVSVPDDSTRSFRATATMSGISSACSAPVTYVEDSTAPAPPALQFNRARANDNSPRLRGEAGGVTVRVFAGDDCQGTPVFAGTPAELDAGFVVNVPDNSVTRMRGVAIDAAGNRSACSPEATFEEDSAAPRTRITFAPGIVTRDRTPSFRFTDMTENEGTSFRCRLDRRAWRACKPPRRYKRLKPGRHVFRVKGIDAAGNRENRAVKRTFRIVGG